MPISIPNLNPAGATPAAGDGLSFIYSGTCSGTAFEHSQTCTIYYKINSLDSGDGRWLSRAITTSGVELAIHVNYNDDLYPFSTSADASGSCDGVANIRQMQVVAFSSFELGAGTSALGASGIVYTLSAGMVRRWARSGDVAESASRFFNEVFYPTGGYTQWQTDPNLTYDMVRIWLRYINTGGLEYSTDGEFTGHSRTPPVPKFYPSLIA